MFVDYFDSQGLATRADRVRRPLRLRPVHRPRHPGRRPVHRRRGHQDRASEAARLRRHGRRGVRPLLPPGLRHDQQPERHRVRPDERRRGDGADGARAARRPRATASRRSPRSRTRTSRRRGTTARSAVDVASRSTRTTARAALRPPPSRLLRARRGRTPRSSCGVAVSKPTTSSMPGSFGIRDREAVRDHADHDQAGVDARRASVVRERLDRVDVARPGLAVGVDHERVDLALAVERVQHRQRAVRAAERQVAHRPQRRRPGAAAG